MIALKSPMRLVTSRLHGPRPDRLLHAGVAVKVLFDLRRSGPCCESIASRTAASGCKLPRIVGVSVRRRAMLGRESGPSSKAPLVCPLTWQSKQATPLDGSTVTRWSVWLNQVVGDGRSSSLSPSICSGVSSPSKISKKLSSVTSCPLVTSPSSLCVVRNNGGGNSGR